MPPEVAGFIREELPIPVIGLGAGTEVDGQLLIVSDVLGIFQAFTPKFVKKYADIAGIATAALTQYVTDVRTGSFPADEHCYPQVLPRGNPKEPRSGAPYHRRWSHRCPILCPDRGHLILNALSKASGLT